MSAKLNNTKKVRTAILVVTMQIIMLPSAFAGGDSLQEREYATLAFLRSMVDSTRAMFASEENVDRQCASSMREEYKDKLELYGRLGVKVKRHFGGWSDLGCYEYTVQDENNSAVSITSYYDLFLLSDFISELRKKNYTDVANQLEQKVKG